MLLCIGRRHGLILIMSSQIVYALGNWSLAKFCMVKVRVLDDQVEQCENTVSVRNFLARMVLLVSLLRVQFA